MFLRYCKLKNYLFVAILFVLKINNFEFNTSGNVSERFFTNATVLNAFRFGDFEPRHTQKTYSERLARGFQFYADNRDLNVDLEFIVPFVRIPVERSMSAMKTTFRSLLNLNVHTLLTTGAIVAFGGIFAIIVKIILSQYAFVSDYKKSLRNGDAYRQDIMMFNQFYNKKNSSSHYNISVESELREKNIDIRHCIQRPLCIYFQQNFYNSSTKANVEGLSRIMDGVFSLDFVHNYLNNTAVKSALDSARNGDNCYKIFSNCNWNFPLRAILKLFAEIFYY